MYTVNQLIFAAIYFHDFFGHEHFCIYINFRELQKSTMCSLSK